MSTDEIPTVIQHLDFELDEVTEPETPKTCGLLHQHPYAADDPYVCGRPAYVQVSLSKPCGHKSINWFCKSCWTAIEDGRLPEFFCWHGKGACNTRFPVKPAITRWEII